LLILDKPAGALGTPPALDPLMVVRIHQGQSYQINSRVWLSTTVTFPVLAR